MPWVNNDNGEPFCWVHPSWAKWEKSHEPPAVDVVLFEGGGPLGGKPFLPPPLPRDLLIPLEGEGSPEEFYREWKAGKRVIPGLKVSIKDVHGNEWGPAECVIKGRWSGSKYAKHFEVSSAVFKPLKKVKLEG